MPIVIECEKIVTPDVHTVLPACMMGWPRFNKERKAEISSIETGDFK